MPLDTRGGSQFFTILGLRTQPSAAYEVCGKHGSSSAAPALGVEELRRKCKGCLDLQRFQDVLRGAPTLRAQR
jgi:hypothetical protein